MTETTKPYDEQFLVGANLREIVDRILEFPHLSPVGLTLDYSISHPDSSSVAVEFTHNGKRHTYRTGRIVTDNATNRQTLARHLSDNLWNSHDEDYIPTLESLKSIETDLDPFYHSETIREFLNTICDWLPDVTEIKRTLKDQAPSDHDGLTVNWTHATGTASTFFPYEKILNDVGNKYLMERMIAYTRLGWTKYSHPSENSSKTLDSLDLGNMTIGYIDKGRVGPLVEDTTTNAPIQVHPVFGSNLPYLDTMPKYTNQPMSPVAPNAPTIINQVSLEEVIEKALGAKIAAMTTAPDSNAPTINVNPSQGLSEEEIAKAVKKYLAHEHPEVLAGASKDSIQELWDAVDTLRVDVERAGTLNPNIVNNIYSDKYKVQS